MNWACAYSIGIDHCPNFFEVQALVTDVYLDTSADMDRRRLKGSRGGGGGQSGDGNEETLWVEFHWDGSPQYRYERTYDQKVYSNYTGGKSCVTEGQTPPSRTHDWYEDRIGQNLTIYVMRSTCDFDHDVDDENIECDCIVTGVGALRYYIAVVFLVTHALSFLTALFLGCMYSRTHDNRIAISPHVDSMHAQQQQQQWQTKQVGTTYMTPDDGNVMNQYSLQQPYTPIQTQQMQQQPVQGQTQPVYAIPVQQQPRQGAQEISNDPFAMYNQPYST